MPQKEQKPRRRKTFDELTITDDFMFGAVFSDPNRCKRLLEEILGITIARIEYPQRQKVMDFSYDSKSIRLDIYVEDEQQTVYNIEMQTTSDGYLALRIRYYHDMIDLNIINKGEDYKHLKKSFVIFICTFDPFDRDRYIYTFNRQCKEEPDIFLNDDAATIVLNCTGHKGDISDDLKNLLHYMAGQPPQGDFAKDIAKSVDEVHKNEKWRRDYMTLNMKIMEERAEADQIADLRRVVSTIRNSKGKITDEILCSILNIDNSLLFSVSEMIDSNPDWTDEEIAEDILGYTE